MAFVTKEDTFIEMTFDEWCDTYTPIKNHIDVDSSFDGEMFETYGNEVEFVKSTPANKPLLSAKEF